ncbi:hypothetical protein BDF20DRAFT_829844 [Mycotypha africana]|uniref:uncharacterized protein n=1 Tax=Mycotypha africana TaxID=64632 RepID=UPI002300D266|nr:uncharacterized protein BDF20DRAFT_829844 [Mycotypha africana]KAI8967228.1 hypothetical protein BDF20DRAFT_829844 [Mycotypha africana]
MRCSVSFARLQSSCLKVVNGSPVALLGLLFGWSYLAYNFSLCFDLFKEGHSLQGFLYTTLYQPIFILCIWSYYVVCSTSPGFTSELKNTNTTENRQDEEDTIGLLSSAALTDNDHESESSVGLELHHMLPKAITVKRNGRRRFCQKCKLDKYDRTHHCRQCKRCVLKMDQQLCKNRTTIEYYEKSNYRLGRHGIDIMRTKYFNPWDIGTRKNIEQVMGKGPLWRKLIPIEKRYVAPAR